MALAHIGVWEWDVESGASVWSDEVYAIFGVTPGAFVPDRRAIEALVHPEDRARLSSAREAAAASGHPLALDFRIVRPDGAARWVSLAAQPERDAGGAVVRVIAALQDVTARRQVEAALEDAVRRAQAVQDSIDAQVVVLDRDGTIVAANAAWHRFEAENRADPDAVTPGYGVGANYLDVCASAADDPCAHLAHEGLRDVLEGRRSGFTLEYPCHAPDAQRWFEMSVSPLRAAGGGAVVVHSNVTGRHLAAEAVRESEQRLRKVVDLVPYPIFARGPDGRYLLANSAFAALYGRVPRGIVGCSMAELGVPAAEIEDSLASDRGVLANPSEVPSTIMRRRDRNGRARTYAVARIPYRHAAPEPDAVLSVAIDVTEIKDTEAELKRSIALLEAILEATEEGIAVTDERGRLTRWNRRFAALADAGTPIASGAALEPLLRPLMSLEGERSGSGDDCIERFALRDGRVLERYRHSIDVDGQVAGALSSLRDVTARVREADAARLRAGELETKVAERTAELTQALADLESFSYSVSHDLRAPLRAMSSFVAIAMEEDTDRLSEEGRRHLRRALAATRNMEAMIEGLLALARHARVPVQRRLFDLASLAHSVFEEIHRDARPVRFTAPGSVAVEADPVLVRVVLQNLLGNALKYTRGREPAEIEFGTERVGGVPRFFVRDNGVGFDPKYAAKLFKPFGRLHSAREFEGTGVGLATVQRIVERHGGRIGAESAPDAGAVFWFTLQRELSPPPTAPQSSLPRRSR